MANQFEWTWLLLRNEIQMPHQLPQPEPFLPGEIATAWAALQTPKPPSQPLNPKSAKNTGTFTCTFQTWSLVMPGHVGLRVAKTMPTSHVHSMYLQETCITKEALTVDKLESESASPLDQLFLKGFKRGLLAHRSLSGIWHLHISLSAD